MIRRNQRNQKTQSDQLKELHKKLRDVKGAIQYFFEEQDLFEHMHLLDEVEKIIDEVGRMIAKEEEKNISLQNL